MMLARYMSAITMGCSLGAFLLALKRDFHPEYRGFINRWLYFFWFHCLPASTFPAFIIVVILLLRGQ